MNGRTRRWGHGRRTQAVWLTKIVQEECRLWRQLCCKTQNLQASGITLGSWEEQKPLPEKRDKRMWMKRMRSELLSVHLTSHPMFLLLPLTQRQNLLEFPSYSAGWGHLSITCPIYLERDIHKESRLLPWSCPEGGPLSSHSRASPASNMSTKTFEAKLLFPLNPFSWS